MRALSGVVAVVALTLAGCGGQGDAPVVSGPGAETPQDVVTQLVDHLGTPDFEAAGELVMPGQAALASLAEGASFGDVADALREGDASVAASFWAGFAQASGTFLAGGIEMGEASIETREQVEFHLLPVRSEAGAERVLVMRELEGYRLDVFASFGAGLAERMTPAVERLLAAQTEDSRLILRHLGDQVPSLLQAASEPGLSGEAVQGLLRLIEVITRVA